MPKVGKWGLAFLLFFTYMMGEFAHWLPVVSSAELANTFKFGDVKCVKVNDNKDDCTDDKCPYDPTADDPTTNNPNNTNDTCHWYYTGDGKKPQALFSYSFLIPISFATIIYGYLSDVVNRAYLLAFTLTMLSVAHFCIGFATNYATLVVCRVFVGFGEAFDPIAASLIADVFDEATKSRGMAIYNWGIYLGYGAAYIVKNLMADIKWLDVEDSWRWMYWLTSGLGFIVAPMLILFVEEPRNTRETRFSEIQTDKDDAIKPSFNSYLRVGLKRAKVFGRACLRIEVLLLLIGGSFRHCAGYAWGYNQNLFLKEKENPTKYDIEFWLMLCTIIGGASGSISGGIINDFLSSSNFKIGKVKLNGLGGGLAILIIALTVAAPLMGVAFWLPIPESFACLYIGYFVAEIWFSPFLVCVANLFPENARGQAIGYTIFVIRLIGGNVPSILITPLKEATTYLNAMIILVPGFYLCGALFFAILLIYISYCKPENETQDDPTSKNTLTDDIKPKEESKVDGIINQNFETENAEECEL